MNRDPSRPAVTSFYEIYDKRSLHEPLSSLPLLDRDRDIKVAKQSARDWGGCVFRVQAQVLAVRPRLSRAIVAAQLLFTAAEPYAPLNEPCDLIGLKELKGKLRQDGRVKYRQRPK
jgi:hypothetical protein